MIKALILAAGESSRMGTPKAALPLAGGRETVVGRVISALRAGGIPEVSVVAGAHVAAVRSAIPTDCDVRVIEHPGWRGATTSTLRPAGQCVRVEGPDLTFFLLSRENQR